MKNFLRFSSLLSLIFAFASANAPAVAKKAKPAKLTASSKNLRLSKSSPSVSFTISTSDDLTCFEDQSGTVPLKVKVNPKLFEASATTIDMPYTDGISGDASLTVSLKDPDSLTKAQKVKFKVLPPQSTKKKCKLKPLVGNLHIDVGQISFSGKVKLPESTATSLGLSFRKTNSLTDVLGRRIGPRNIEEVTGAVVELVEVDDQGEVISEEPIATAITDDNGEYELELPEGAQLGTHYAVQVGEGDEAVHAFVNDEHVELDPTSEFIFENVQEEIVEATAAGNTIDVENFTGDEVEALQEQLEDLNLEFGETVRETLATFEGSLGSFIDNMVAAASGEESNGEESTVKINAKGIAGDYFVSFFETSLMGKATENSPVSAGTSTMIELGAARLSKPTQAGALGVIAVPVLSAEVSLDRTGEFDPNFGGGDGGDFGGDFGGPEDGDQGGVDTFDFDPCAPETFDETICQPGQDPGDQDQGDFGGECDPSVEQCDGDPFGNEGDFGGDENDFGDEGQGGGDERTDYGAGSSAYRLEAFNERGNLGEIEEFFVSIDANNVISFVEPGESHPHDLGPGERPAVFRDDPIEEAYYQVGDGLFLSSGFGHGVIYDAVTEETLGQDYFMGFGALVKESDIGDDDLQGNYGLIGMGIDLSGHGRMGVMSNKGTVEIVDGIGTAYFSDFEISRESQDGETFTIETSSFGDGTEPSGSAKMTANKGKITLTMLDEGDEDERCGGQCDTEVAGVFEGYARSDGAVVIFVSSSDRKNNPNSRRISSANREIDFTVRLSSSAPNLSGNTYTLLAYGAQFDTDGSLHTYASNGGTMSFSGSSVTFADTTMHKATRIGDEGNVSKEVVDGPLGSADTTISSVGGLDFTLNEETFTGYISEDEKLIILRGNTSNKAMMYLGVLQ